MKLFQKPDLIIIEIIKRRLIWTEHAWRKTNFYIKRIIEEELVGRKLLGNPCLRGMNKVKEYVGTVAPNSH